MLFSIERCRICSFLSTFLYLGGINCGITQDAYTVDTWAENLGSELWELARAVTRPEELLSKYRSPHVKVEEKSGEELVEIIGESVGRMLKSKMDAVTCIRMVAEEAAEMWNSSFAYENFTYVSGKYSPVTNVDTEIELPANLLNNSNIYREITLTADRHFYNIPINTNFSSVHIPTNVYDLRPTVANDIEWSEGLDDIFQRNYESDPALSWQYFGSVTGMLRQYPAMQWRTDRANPNSDEGDATADIYDCRVRSWFIEAATCSKDMVILVDVSGSMTGMGRTIAKTTVASILDTLSNNDFVTVLKYSEETDEVVPCFKDMLVQATPENVDMFKRSMKKLNTEEVANATNAFNKAFSLLRTYREMRGCGEDTPCNQLIMLVTDGVPGNLTEVFEAWNWQENSTHIPVRVFTYLLGREVTKVREIQWMACLNRGYYTHIHAQEEVREQVFKYIPVVARPMVLHGKIHPVVWTHAYADISNPALATWLWLVMEHEEQKTRLLKHQKGKQLGVRINEDAVYIQQLHKDEDVRQDASMLNTTAWQEYRLLTSVSTPVFDRKGNKNNQTRLANLLGVAGTDVPISDIRKLTLPYKLGVNGYAFIVSNNGYVILHPDLRPVHRGGLKLNYNSVDLTEVEILNDGRPPRNPGSEVLELRAALVDHKRGRMKNIPVKLHYDNNRRVTLERRDYFYAPLPGTPFGLAVALPNYGTTWIKVGDEIGRNERANISVSEYFDGDRWRIHPIWIYCRYHYTKEHRFDSSEDELKHFLAKLDKPGWRWSEQYQAHSVNVEQNTEDEEIPECGKRTLSHNDYYCNEELMQLLVFDAKGTYHNFMYDLKLNDPREQQLAEKYGVYLRFIATQSGLTRWHKLSTNNNNNISVHDEGIEFGDLHRRAVNEPWYKGAIFQNNLDPWSISLTVPWEAGADAVVTASIGLFPGDGNKKTPAAVVGFQMPMTDLYKRFIEITTKSSDSSSVNCKNDWIDCYLLDQNGYVVISEAHNDTGQFMGTQEGAVMKSMVEQGLYEGVEIYDYQAWCEEIHIEGLATSLTNPFEYVWKLFLWILYRMSWLASQFVAIPGASGKGQMDDDDMPDPPPPPREVLHHHPCDQKRILYIMNQSIAELGISNHSKYCSRPFYARRVTHTNLLLVVVDALYPTCYERLQVTPVEISPFEYTNGTLDRPCHKIPLNDLKRRRLEGCFTEHPLEIEIEACGRATGINSSWQFIFLFVCNVLLRYLQDFYYFCFQ